MNLRDLLGNYKILKTIGSIDIDILGIEHDSRLIQKNFFLLQRKVLRMMVINTFRKP